MITIATLIDKQVLRDISRFFVYYFIFAIIILPLNSKLHETKNPKTQFYTNSSSFESSDFIVLTKSVEKNLERINFNKKISNGFQNFYLSDLNFDFNRFRKSTTFISPKPQYNLTKRPTQSIPRSPPIFS